MCIESYRAQVTVTDLEDLQTLLRVNIIENRALVTSGSVSAKVLKWFVLMFLFIHSWIGFWVIYPSCMFKIFMQTVGFPLFPKGWRCVWVYASPKLCPDGRLHLLWAGIFPLRLHLDLLFETWAFATLQSTIITAKQHNLGSLSLHFSFHAVHCSTSGELEAALWTRDLHYVLLWATHWGCKPKSGEAVFWGEKWKVWSICKYL